MKLLFIQLGRIGDMVLLTSAFKALKEKYPDSIIDVLAGRKNYQILKDNPKVNNIIIFNKSPFKLIQTISKISKLKYDFYIDPKDHHSTEGRFIAGFVKSAKKIGFNGYKRKIFDISIPSDIENSGLHSITRIFNSLKPLSISIGETIPKPELFTNSDSEEYVNSFLGENEIDKFILINLSAGSKSRMLSVEKWTELLNKIINENRSVLSFAPAENEMAIELSKSFNNLNLFQSRSINDVISLVKKTKLLITPNTSLVHIASAFDTPIIAFYNSDDEDCRKFRALSSKQKVIFLSENMDDLKENEIENILSTER
ncbi:MAG: glycosyltransferase family 9 protein [Bacteroidetes bacterium]|nr:glycosyltransferase family 9 protein [Bacteroidota bacterium]